MVTFQIVVQWKKSSKDKEAVKEKVNDEAIITFNELKELKDKMVTHGNAIDLLTTLGSETKNRVSAVGIELKDLKLSVERSAHQMEQSIKEFEKIKLEWIDANHILIRGKKP